MVTNAGDDVERDVHLAYTQFHASITKWLMDDMSIPGVIFSHDTTGSQRYSSMRHPMGV